MSTYHYDTMSDEVLRRDFVPDVYQHDIYMIDYQRLKDAGIKLISFDIDDTIASLEDFTASEEAKILIQKLKNMGFDIVLLTNAKDTRGSHFGKVLGVDHIARAKKPLSKNFELLQERYGLEKNQMAHVGNSQINDVAGGNIFGITTCMTRNMGWLENWKEDYKQMIGKNEGHALRKVLKSRNIWRKHHKEVKGDQYYQLGEIPAYQK